MNDKGIACFFKPLTGTVEFFFIYFLCGYSSYVEPINPKINTFNETVVKVVTHILKCQFMILENPWILLFVCRYYNGIEMDEMIKVTLGIVNMYTLHGSF